VTMVIEYSWKLCRSFREVIPGERGLLLVFFLDCDLVVPGVAVEEAEQVAAHRGVNDLVYPKGSLGQCFLRSV
jgi:hypothetical protein